MAPELKESTNGPSMASLVGGIITDAQELIKQQFALFRREIQLELRQAKNAAISLSVGVGLAAIGGFLLLFMLIHLLNYMTELPLWACYGIVGGGILLVGVIAILVGRNEAAHVELAPPPQTAETLKENWQWLKGETISSHN